MKILTALYLSEYKIEVTFKNGKILIADFENFIKSSFQPMTSQFKNIKKFQNFRIHFGNLAWQDHQMDISAESIYKGEFTNN